jgi:hypothetical protein
MLRILIGLLRLRLLFDFSFLIPVRLNALDYVVSINVYVVKLKNRKNTAKLVTSKVKCVCNVCGLTRVTQK